MVCRYATQATEHRSKSYITKQTFFFLIITRILLRWLHCVCVCFCEGNVRLCIRKSDIGIAFGEALYDSFFSLYAASPDIHLGS